MESDYIKLSRSILDWEWWEDANTTRLFLYMLLKANWKEGKFKGINVPRGSFVSSLAKLAEGTGMSIDAVRTAVDHLVDCESITKQSTNKFTLFSVVNYDLYQSKSQAEPEQIPNKYQANTKQSPSRAQADTKQIPTIEEKKEDNISLSVNTCMESCKRFAEFWETYPKKVNMLNAQSEYICVLETTAGLTEDNLLIAAKNYAEYCGIRKTREQYTKNPENWLKESIWIDYLPENYKRPLPVKNPENTTKKNRFNNFPQRVYDYDALEKQLLN